MAFLRKKSRSRKAPPAAVETDRQPIPEPASGSSPASEDGHRSEAVGGERPESWEDIEREMIIEAPKEHGGNRTRCSESLGWGRMKLWRKMKHYNLL